VGVAAETIQTPSAVVPWHARPGEQVLEHLESGPAGLSEAEASARLHRDGPNRIERQEGPRHLTIWLAQVRSPLIYALLASAALALALGELVDGSVVLAVVMANAAIGYLQESRAGKAIAALAELVREQATVVRGGEPRRIDAEELVAGDLVLLEAGEQISADMRLLGASSLSVDESLLTGESVPVAKGPAPVALGEGVAGRTDMLYAGAFVKAGSGQGVVVATGADTELGRISQLLGGTELPQTPLTRSLATLGERITAAIAVVAVVLLAVGLARGLSLSDSALAAITLAVAAVPEGLPAIVTIALAVGVRRMARRRAVIRRLPAVETLGSTTVIATDKTGTLTRNEMTVRRLWTPEGSYQVSGSGYEPAGELRDEDGQLKDPSPDLIALVEAGALCNDASLEEQDGRWSAVGDPTEAALLVAARKAGTDLGELRIRHPRVAVLPFDSERGFMATAHGADGGPALVVLKGAPELMLERCRLDEQAAISVRAEVDRLAGEGMRVLAVASHEARIETNNGQQSLREIAARGGLRLLGLEAMIDPPRVEVADAVTACQNAGIAVKMVTGDHPQTATAIARELGLAGQTTLTGAQIEALHDDELQRQAHAASVFARVLPEHKLRLVRALRGQGEVVAMTGDGVNDAPALKQADVGVAMGGSGTAVARESAELVLADDNFATVAAAVEEGRRVYDNLVKALAFVLPTNLGEALLILIAVVAFPITAGDALLPAEPVQILWINLVATVALALPLAFEAREPGLMNRPPRGPAEPLLSRFVIARTVGVAILMTAAAIVLFVIHRGGDLDAQALSGDTLAESQTLVITALVLFQIAYLLQCRTLDRPVREIGLFSNPTIFAGIGILILLQLAFVYLPVMNDLFGSAPLAASDWSLAAVAAALVFPAIASEKRWRRRRSRL
jgi:magnesium-transporting ATPase (P-type)